MKKIIADATTGEVQELDMTPEEIAEYEQMQADAEAQDQAAQKAQAEREALKASAKQKLIAGEPLTEAEADTLVL